MIDTDFFSHLEVIIFDSLICAGLILFGIRYLTKEALDLYEDCRERRRRWRSSPPSS